MVEDWHSWPIHAASGTTQACKVFTSGRIVAPEVASDMTFTLDADGAGPETSIKEPTTIEFQIGGKWQPATTEYQKYPLMPWPLIGAFPTTVGKGMVQKEPF